MLWITTGRLADRQGGTALAYATRTVNHPGRDAPRIAAQMLSAADEDRRQGPPQATSRGCRGELALDPFVVRWLRMGQGTDCSGLVLARIPPTNLEESQICLARL